MDIYDGADWTEMDIDGLRADMESSSSIKEAAEFLCRSRSTDDVARKCEELGLKPKLRKRRMRSRGTGCPATMASTPMALPRPKQTISLNVPAAIKGSTCATSVRSRSTSMAPMTRSSRVTGRRCVGHDCRICFRDYPKKPMRRDRIILKGSTPAPRLVSDAVSALVDGSRHRLGRDWIWRACTSPKQGR